MVREHTLTTVFIIALLLKSRCERQENKGNSPTPGTYAYKALAGELFVMQCASPYQTDLFNQSKSLEESVSWLKYERGTGTIVPGNDDGVTKRGNALQFTEIEDRHAGNYSCYPVTQREEVLHFIVDVVQRNDCKEHGKTEIQLTVANTGTILCPGASCYTHSSNTVIRWYKNNMEMNRRADGLTVDGPALVLHTVYKEDEGNFTCDFDLVDGNTWTVRRVVRVTVVARDTEALPQILHPHGKESEEVTLGKSHTLTCKAQFGFEKAFHPVIQWRVSYHDDGSLEQLETDRVVDKRFEDSIIIGTTYLEQVTQRHLRATFTCFAKNSRGNTTATVRLWRRPAASGLLQFIIGPCLVLVVLTGVSVLVRVFWTEIFLLYRTYVPPKESTAGGKEYDAFVSYARSSSSDERDVMAEILSLYHLPRVLEQQWGYKLCLLERDLVPGGAYTEEVVRSIQKSRRVICVLSSCYLRGPHLFELETSLKNLEQEGQPRVILIWSSRPPPGPLAVPLPPTVNRALRVLPATYWTPADSECSDSRFWKVLRLAMPATKVRLVSSYTGMGQK